MESSGAQKQPPVMQKRFRRVARRYDLLNRVMSLGRDESWRKEAVCALAVRPAQAVLDVGTGTGDLILRIAKERPDSFLVACDLTPEMIALARRRPEAARVNWVIADAQQLPFAAGSFGRVVSGFLLRNTPDPGRAIQEQARVLAKEGRIAVLDTTPPRPGPFRWPAVFYLRCVVPLLGGLLAGNRADYRYLQQSTETFLSAEEIGALLRSASFSDVVIAWRMLGNVTILSGKRA